MCTYFIIIIRLIKIITNNLLFNFFWNRDEIVKWIKKKTGPTLQEVSSVDEVTKATKESEVVFLAYVSDFKVRTVTYNRYYNNLDSLYHGAFGK